MSNVSFLSRLARALHAARTPEKKVAEELRRMASGKGPYSGFDEFSPFILNVWLAAAELLDPEDQNNRPTQ